MTTASNQTNNSQKRDGRVSTFWALGVILLVLAIAFSIGWASRGPRIHDFTGIGQARILDVTRYERGGMERSDTVYRYKVQITAGQETFVDRYDYSSNKWRKGDVRPITYNIKNPHEYVIDDTPEEYTRWYNTMGIITLGMLLGAVFCLGNSYRIKRRIVQDAEIR